MQPNGSPTGRIVFALEAVRQAVEVFQGRSVVLVNGDGAARGGGGGQVILVWF